MAKLEILYQVLCIAAAVGMTTFCIVKYVKNESVVSVNHREFHQTPTDVYPSISICFGQPFMKTNNTEDAKVENMMKGLKKWNQSLLENVTYEDMTIKLDANEIKYVILEYGPKSKIICQQSDCFKTIGDARKKCFTHDIKFEGHSKLLFIEIHLDNAKSTLADHNMKIYLHHPGQLFRNSLQPVLNSKRSSNRSLITFNIQSVTVLRKREDDKTGCNPASSEDDEIILRKAAKMVNCTSKYPG